MEVFPEQRTGVGSGKMWAKENVVCVCAARCAGPKIDTRPFNSVRRSFVSMGMTFPGGYGRQDDEGDQGGDTQFSTQNSRIFTPPL